LASVSTDIVVCLSEVEQFRSAVLHAHESMVGKLCFAFCEAAGFRAEYSEKLLRAAALHDIGKVTIPDAILNKPGPLDPAEWNVMRHHTRLGHAAIAQIVIERRPGKVTVTVHTGRPGVVIGKRGAEVDKLRDELAQLTGKEAAINVEEIKRPEVSSQLVADNIAHQLVQRISFRRAMKRAVQSAMRMGAQGIRVRVSGRLGGSVNRTEDSLRKVAPACSIPP